MQGKIIKGIAGFYYIHVETSGIYECKAKGIFRNRHIKPLVGDNVEIEVIDKDNFKGNVVDILPRKNELIRPASANIDQAMVIFAVKTPEPNFNLLDKFILMMNYQDVPTVVCFNKEELADDEYKNEFIKQIKIRFWRLYCKYNHRLVNIGRSRSYKFVLSWKDVHHISFEIILINNFYLHIITNQWFNVSVSEYPFCLTFINTAGFYMYIVETSDTLNYLSLHINNYT
jgi:translation initiation factor IF-1